MSVMYAIQLNGVVLPARYEHTDVAIEAAQETLALPPDAPWQIVILDNDGNWRTA